MIFDSGDDCTIPDCPGEPNCHGRGYCDDTLDPPRCTSCNSGWFGPSCSHPCIHGNHDPDNTMCVCNTTCLHGAGCNVECSLHGTCNAEFECYCEPLDGWSGKYCEIPGCPQNPVTYEECSGHGDCNSQSRVCSCFAGWTGVACYIPDCPGTPDCNTRGFCNVTFDPPRCTNCTGPWMGPACSDPCVHGSQTPMDSGYCLCEAGWAGVGCNSECSGHGTIIDGVCVCDYLTGWKGPLCDIPGCPGLFNLDCSGRGQIISWHTVFSILIDIFNSSKISKL